MEDRELLLTMEKICRYHPYCSMCPFRIKTDKKTVFDCMIRIVRNNIDENEKIVNGYRLASVPKKAPDKCTCGDCHYFHGPTGFNRYGKEIGECYAQKDAPTVEKDEKSCSDFDWKGDKDE